MFITDNFNSLAVEVEQRDDQVDIVRRQAWISVESKRFLLRETDNAATRIIVVSMHLEAALGWCGCRKVFLKIIVSAIPSGVAVRFAIGKRHSVNQEVIADFEEDADFGIFDSDH